MDVSSSIDTTGVNDKPHGEERIPSDELALGRHVALLHNVVNQLDLEAQLLVASFLRNTGPTSASTSSGKGIGTDDSVAEVNVKEQWDSVKVLCMVLAEQLPSYKMELNPQLFSLGAIVDKVIRQERDNTVAKRLPNYNLPFSVLKLVAASKRAVLKELHRLSKTVTEDSVKAALAAVNSSSVALHQLLKHQLSRRESIWQKDRADYLSEADMLSELMKRSQGKPQIQHQPTLVNIKTEGRVTSSFRVRSVSDGVNPNAGPLPAGVSIRKNLAEVRETQEHVAETPRPRLHSVDATTLLEGPSKEALLSRKKTLLNKSKAGQNTLNPPKIAVDPSSELSRDLDVLAKTLDSDVSLQPQMSRSKPAPIIASSAAIGTDPPSASTICNSSVTKSAARDRVVLIPINGMFPLVAVDLSDVTRFGRSNTRRHPFFKTFDSQVVSRNHLEIWNENGKIFTRDVGSNGGTFLNGHRLGESGQVSEIVELKSGDYLQMGRDFLCETEPGIPIELKDAEAKACTASSSLDKGVTALHWKKLLFADDSVLLVNKKHRSVKIQIALLRLDESSSRFEQSRIEESHGILTPGTKQLASNPPNPRTNTLLIDTSIINPFPTIFSAPPATTEYQRQLEAQKRDIERRLEAQQEKIQRDLQQLASCLSASNISDSFSHVDYVPKGKRPSRQVAALDVEGSQAATAAAAKRRVRMTLVTCFMGSKIKKAALQAEGCDSDLFSIDLRNWESKKSMFITDLRPRFFSTAEIDITSIKDSTKDFTITAKSPMTQSIHSLGTITQASSLKLEITPTSTTHRYTLTGDLRDSKFIVVQRFASSREQKLVGESHGRKLARKSVRETRWTTELELEETDEAAFGGTTFVECPQVLMAAVIFAHILGQGA